MRAPVLAQRFPRELPFGFLGRTLPTTEPIDLIVEAYPVPPGEALEMLEGARSVAVAELAGGSGGASTPELEVERESSERFGRAVAGRDQELWKVGFCFSSHSGSLARAEAVRTRLVERLRALGFRTRVPRYEAAAALAPPSLMGSEPRPEGYWHTLPTDGVAALFPFGDESVVEPRGILVGLALADASPVFLNRWAHASHSWGFFGTTGSGKTFAAALTVLRTRWMQPDVSVAILDPLGEFGGFVRSLGGAVIGLGRGTGGRLNPLDPTTTGGDRREKAGRVGTMVRALFPSLTDEESAAFDAALSRLYEQESAVPTFEDLIRTVREVAPTLLRLPGLLEVFRTGSLRAANGPTTVTVGAPIVSVDFRGVPDDQLPFHLSYVLDWAYGRMRGGTGPKLVLVDEAHLLLRRPATAEFLDRVVRHVRHLRGGLLLASQSPEDFLATASGRSILANLYAIALLRLTEVSAEARRFLALTPSEAEWIPRARRPREAGYSESLWRIRDLHLPLAIIASTPEYDFLRAVLGHPEDDAEPALRAGGL